MNKTCAKWRDQLLETALGENGNDELNSHLSQCSDCTNELARRGASRERLEALRPSRAGAEPAADLANRILAVAKSKTTRISVFTWRRWAIAAAAAIIVIAVMSGWILNRPANVPDHDLIEAMALAHWQAPTDVLLRIPNHEQIGRAHV